METDAGFILLHNSTFLWPAGAGIARENVRPMLIVHHLEHSRSQRVLWLLEELGVEYEIRQYARDAKSRLAPAALKAVHPLGKSPVITDGGRTIAETGAIIEYLLDRYGGGRLRPAPDSDDYLQYRYWLHAAEGSIMPLLVMKLVFNATTTRPVPFFIRPITRAVAGQVGKAYLDPGIADALGLMEKTLGEQAWFAGAEFSGADIMMSFPVQAAFVRTATPAEYPRLHAFRERIEARPAYQAALEKGGPYELMG